MNDIPKCPICHTPLMPQWDSCPYCSTVSSEAKNKDEGKDGNSVGTAVIFLLISILLSIVSGFFFYTLDDEKTARSKGVEEARVAYDMTEKNIRLLRKSNLSCAKNALLWWNFVNEDKRNRCTEEESNAYASLIRWASENVRKFKDLTTVEKIVVKYSLDISSECMPKGVALLTDNRWDYSCPLEIKTSAGSGGYVVKVEDVDTGREIVSIFISAGSPCEIGIPAGTYRIKYLQGNNWYGKELLFGYECSASVADKKFTFSRGEGFTVTLYKMTHGNLSTTSLDIGAF